MFGKCFVVKADGRYSLFDKYGGIGHDSDDGAGDIEVFFRTAKRHLELEKGCQGRDFDALIAHTAIVMTRYIFLSIEKRRTEDPRTLGLLFFHRCREEAEDCTLVRVLCQILGITLENLKKLGEAQSQAERMLLEAFQEGRKRLGWKP